jgi:hypothetical protein
VGPSGSGPDTTRLLSTTKEDLIMSDYPKADLIVRDDRLSAVMPSGGDGDDGVDLSVNPLFSRIKPQPGDQRRFVFVAGFIGDVKDGVVRVYPTLNLGTYYEIPQKEILFAEKVNPSQKASPTAITLDAGTRIGVVRASAGEIESGFLTGKITAENLGSTRRAAAAGTDVPAPVVAVHVNSAASPNQPAVIQPPRSACVYAGHCVSDPPAFNDSI